MSLFRQLLMVNSQRKRRPYYCEVEYLESTGTQYIDTGIFGSSDIEYEGYVHIPDDQYDAILGCWKVDDNATRFDLYNGGNAALIYASFGSESVIISKNNMTDFNFSYKNKKLTINGVSRDVTQTSFTTERAIFLFGNNRGSIISTATSGTRIYYCKLFDNGVLVRDFVPILDWDMRPGMYDKVSGKIFYNLGTDTDFSYGREIHYVEYLESTGTQYIDVGLPASLKNEFDVDFQYTGPTNGAIFGARTGQAVENCVLFIITPTYDYLRFDYNQQHSINWPTGSDNHSHYRFTNTFTDTNQITVFEDLETGTKITSTQTLPTEINNALNMVLFAVNTNSTIQLNAVCKMYHWSMKDDGVLVRDCYPAIDENGVAFMFDKVEHQIYDNSGTGVFKHPDVVLEYLEATGTQYIDTGVKPDDTYGYKVDLAQTGTRNPQTYDQCPIGAMETQKRFVGTYFGNRSAETTNRMSYGWGGIDNIVSITKAYSLNERVLSYCNYKNDRKIIFNNELIKDITGVVLPQLTENIRLFMRLFESNTGNFMGRIYGAELTQGNDVIHKYTPIIRDGVAGMLDTITGDFFTNAGTGNFKMKIKENKK